MCMMGKGKRNPALFRVYQSPIAAVLATRPNVSISLSVGRTYDVEGYEQVAGENKRFKVTAYCYEVRDGCVALVG